MVFKSFSKSSTLPPNVNYHRPSRPTRCSKIQSCWTTASLQLNKTVTVLVDHLLGSLLQSSTENRRKPNAWPAHNTCWQMDKVPTHFACKLVKSRSEEVNWMHWKNQTSTLIDLASNWIGTYNLRVKRPQFLSAISKTKPNVGDIWSLTFWLTALQAALTTISVAKCSRQQLVGFLHIFFYNTQHTMRCTAKRRTDSQRNLTSPTQVCKLRETINYIAAGRNVHFVRLSYLWDAASVSRRDHRLNQAAMFIATTIFASCKINKVIIYIYVTIIY